MCRRVAVVEDNSARLILVTDIVTYDDELSPLQVRGIIDIYANVATLHFWLINFVSAH